MTSSDPEEPTSGEQPGPTGSEPLPPASRADRAQLPADVDAAFAAIVADWAADGAPAWPARTEADTTTDTATDTAAEHPDGPSSGIGTATPPTGHPAAGPPPDLPRPAGPVHDPGAPPPAAHRPHPAASDPADEHFVPPEPPPLPRLGLSSLAGIGLLIIGVVLLAVPSLLGASLALGIVPGLLAMTAGLGWLVLGMRRPNEGDDDPDGGAVL